LQWYQEALENLGCNTKKMLEAVGKIMAANGEYSFWKDMARTYDVISAEKIEQKHTIIPADLGKYDELTDEQIERAQQRIMASLRGEEDKGDSRLLDDASEGQEPSENGADSLQERSLEIPIDLG